MLHTVDFTVSYKENNLIYQIPNIAQLIDGSNEKASKTIQAKQAWLHNRVWAAAEEVWGSYKEAATAEEILAKAMVDTPGHFLAYTTIASIDGPSF